jgi:N-terminal domain of galactosyltransferase/Glycosyl transferase family 2
MSQNPPRLSLLTTYRGRKDHLRVLLGWLNRIRETEGFTDFELILVEGDVSPTAEAAAAAHHWVRYIHVPMEGVFHKQVLINHAVALARGEYLIPYDVDLLPADGVLAKHLELAAGMPRCLVAGYRVQLDELWGVGEALPTSESLVARMSVKNERLLCGEDVYSSLLEYLLQKQRFGVNPCIPAKVFHEVGGVDERYVGWGADDQDLIERVCESGLMLIRPYELLYFHLPHEYEEGWASPEQVEANRRRYHAARSARLGGATPPTG